MNKSVPRPLLAAFVVSFLLGCDPSSSLSHPDTPPASGSIHSDHQQITYDIHRVRVDKPFADVVEELEFAISEKNYRVTGVNKLGSALRERGYADFPEAQVIHYCSVENAREFLLLDAGYIAMMPCRITVHTELAQTVISMIFLPEDHANPKINELARKTNQTMRAIVDFAVQQNATAAVNQGSASQLTTPDR